MREQERKGRTIALAEWTPAPNASHPKVAHAVRRFTSLSELEAVVLSDTIQSIDHDLEVSGHAVWESHCPLPALFGPPGGMSNGFYCHYPHKSAPICGQCVNKGRLLDLVEDALQDGFWTRRAAIIRPSACTLDMRVRFLKKIILLVEDSRLQRVASARALVKAGYDVVSVADGEAALLTARERTPDLILLDMMLPKLDGLGVLRALKHDPETASIPVIVLTGLAQQNEAKLKKEGAAAYFTKSDSLLMTDSDMLLHVVESVVGKQGTVGLTAAIPATIG